MSRSLHRAFAAGAPRRGRWLILALAAGSLATLTRATALSRYLGQPAAFAPPLKAEQGDLVGIAVPTWALTLAAGLPSNRGGRARGCWGAGPGRRWGPRWGR